MQKAFAELERNGLIVTQRTTGRTVTLDEEVIKNSRQNMAKQHVEVFIKNMKELGFSLEDVKSLIEETYNRD